MFPITAEIDPCKLDGISFLNNIEYSSESMKAYKIGKGKVMKWNDLNQPTTLPHLEKKRDENQEVSFVSVKPRKASSKGSNKEGDAESSDDESPDTQRSECDAMKKPDDEKLFFFAQRRDVLNHTSSTPHSKIT